MGAIYVGGTALASQVNRLSAPGMEKIAKTARTGNVRALWSRWDLMPPGMFNEAITVKRALQRLADITVGSGPSHIRVLCGAQPDRTTPALAWSIPGGCGRQTPSFTSSGEREDDL